MTMMDGGVAFLVRSKIRSFVRSLQLNIIYIYTSVILMTYK